MVALTGGALLAAGLGAGLQAFGASQAAGAAGHAAEKNAALFREMFAKAEGYLQPYIGRGDQAGGMYLDALMGGPRAASAFDAYKSSAGFESTLAEGVNALNSNAANRKLLNSGKTMKDVVRFGQEHNQRYYDSWLGKLALPQQLGAASAGSLAGSAFNFANLGAQNNNNLADTQGNAWLFGTSALTNFLKAGAGGLGGMGGGSAFGYGG